MKRAYVTLLCGGDGYVPGVEVLGKSLEATGTLVPRVLLATQDVSLSARGDLTELGWEIRDVAAIANPGASPLFPHFDMVYTKLRAWNLDDIEKVVFLDADTLVLQNIDDLFERNTFAAAPDFFLPDRFNSGVMVLEPSPDTYHRMVERLSTAVTYDGGDQGFLNSFFPDWYSLSGNARLPAGCNMANFSYQFLRSHPDLWKTLEKEVRIVHYLLQKPWQSTAVVTGGSEAWWASYFLVHPDGASGWKQRLHSLQDHTFERMIAGVVH